MSVDAVEVGMGVLSAPLQIDQRVLTFCEGISPEKPVYVRVKPVTNANLSHCFDNVSRQIKLQGGAVAYGWAIWHWPGKYFEAEHHGVWRSPDGALLDVSPQLDGRNQILFLPDPTAIYDPTAFRSNILEAEGNDPVAAEFVRVGQEFLRIIDRYRRPGVTSPVFALVDQLRLLQLKARTERLSLRMND